MRWLLPVLALVTLAAGCGTLSEISFWPGAGVSVSLDSLDDQHAAFKRAYDAVRRHDDQTAFPLFRALQSAYPALADYHLYFGAVSAARLGRDDDAERMLGRLLSQYPDSVHVPAAELELGQLELRLGNLDAARAHLYRCAEIAGDNETARGARLAIADAEERFGDINAAYRGFSEVRAEVPGSPLGRLAKEHVVAMRASHPERQPSGNDRLREARLLMVERDYGAAEGLAGKLRDQPRDFDPAVVMRLLADAQYGLGNLEPALKTLWAIAERYPNSPEAPQALFRMAGILWNRDRDSAARRLFEDFRKRYPRHEKAAEALYAIGRIEQKAGHVDTAIAAYQELARGYPRAKEAAEARWRIGWIHYRNDRWGAAASAFAQARGGASATYWQARALEHAGQRATARQLFRRIVADEPDGYYGLWAQRRLDAVAGALRLNGHAPESAPLLIVDAGSFDESFHRPRAEELKAAGQLTLARGELAAIERAYGQDPAALRFLVAAYPRFDGQASAAHLARRLDAGVISELDRNRLSYPLAYWSTVRLNADALLVDPLLVVAVMRQESLFDPQARSSADARGLMQLLPSTAERVASSSPEPIDVGDLNDPDVNIALGVRYLRSLSDRFGGDPLKVVAAYNGGEDAVDKWQQQAAGLEADELVESITYRETRDYVKRVLANYQHYGRLYSGQ
jgi:soluble lytic murein transglycosylase